MRYFDYPLPPCPNLDEPNASKNSTAKKEIEHTFVEGLLVDDFSKLKAKYVNPKNSRDPLKYGKASGMLLAAKYYPRHFPFYDLALIRELAEWKALKNEYGEQMIHRIDYPLGSARRNAVVGTNGFKESVSGLISDVHKQGSTGVVMLWKCRDTIVPRYQSAGGFNISFSVGREVVIELVGCGFDGSDLTRGAELHERYRLPWSAVRDLRRLILSPRSTLADISTEVMHIGQDGDIQSYHDSVARRSKMLVDECHYDIDVVHSIVPQRAYVGIDDNALRSLYDTVVAPTVARAATFWRAGLTEFAVQGNLPYRQYTGWSIEVWELFRPIRWERHSALGLE